MFNTIEELVEDIRSGKMVILVDDEDRENEGDIVIAAQHISDEKVNFMVKEARGLVCLSITEEQCQRLNLPLMIGDDQNFSPNKTAFTVSIEATEGVSTGISAADRALTIQAASNPQATPADIITPGHIFPIRAQNGGVLKRAGHTEGSVDLARLAGLNPSAVICEVMNDDGTMARVDDLKIFAKKHDLKIGTIVDLIEYRLQNETLIEELPGEGVLGDLNEGFQTRIFRNTLDGTQHIALTRGDVDIGKPTLVRVQSENMMNDLLASLHSKSSKLAKATQLIDDEGCGVVLYLRRPPGANGEESPMDKKDYGIGAQILRALGVSQIRLLSDHPKRRIALKGYGLEIVETLPIESPIEDLSRAVKGSLK